MTERAANQENRSIAIILNGKVKSVPRVMSPIYGGHCSISASYTKDEAQNLTKSLSIGRLDYKLKLMRKTVLGK